MAMPHVTGGNEHLGTLGDVLPAIQAHLVGQSSQAALPIPAAKKYCVVLIDGLGFYNLKSVSADTPFLSKHLRGSLTSAIPSTTATNLSYFGTGFPGGKTGMLGYTVRHPHTGRIMNLISWNGGPDPEIWQPQAPIFERLRNAGIVTVSVGPWKFEGSGLTQAALRGSEFEAAETLEERIEAASYVATEPDVQLIYLYWGEVDAVGHQYGPSSPQWRHEVTRIDTALAELRDRLPADMPMVVTADHGMIDIPPTDSEVFHGPSRIDIAQIEELHTGVSALAGEPRFLHVHTHHGESDHVRRRWEQYLGHRALVMSRQTARAEGLFGEVSPQNLEVIGDVVVAMLGDVTVGDSRFQSPHALQLLGMHGSITPTESTVPLIVA